MNITREIAQKVLTIVDAGLSSDPGNPRPVEMCVEDAVCYVLGLPYSDDPGCVSPALRKLKIALNDANWSSNAARARGLRRLTLAQIGSKDILDEDAFVLAAAQLVTRTCVPIALMCAARNASEPHKLALMKAAERCECEGTKEAASIAADAAQAARSDQDDQADQADGTSARSAMLAAVNAADTAGEAGASNAIYAAYAAVNAAEAAEAAEGAGVGAGDKIMADFAEGVVQILVAMKAPGCLWLSLTERK